MPQTIDLSHLFAPTLEQNYGCVLTKQSDIENMVIQEFKYCRDLASKLKQLRETVRSNTLAPDYRFGTLSNSLSLHVLAHLADAWNQFVKLTDMEGVKCDDMTMTRMAAKIEWLAHNLNQTPSTYFDSIIKENLHPCHNIGDPLLCLESYTGTFIEFPDIKTMEKAESELGMYIIQGDRYANTKIVSYLPEISGIRIRLDSTTMAQLSHIYEIAAAELYGGEPVLAATIISQMSDEFIDKHHKSIRALLKHAIKVKALRDRISSISGTIRDYIYTLMPNGV